MLAKNLKCTLFGETQAQTVIQQFAFMSNERTDLAKERICESEGLSRRASYHVQRARCVRATQDQTAAAARRSLCSTRAVFPGGIQHHYLHTHTWCTSSIVDTGEGQSRQTLRKTNDGQSTSKQPRYSAPVLNSFHWRQKVETKMAHHQHKKYPHFATRTHQHRTEMQYLYSTHEFYLRDLLEFAADLHLTGALHVE